MHTASPVEILVNGEKKTIETNTSLAVFLAELGLQHNAVAVELNGLIVRKHNHPLTLLSEGDVLEIVTFVGGG